MSVRARAPAAALHACPRRGARAARRRAATAAVEVASAPAGAAVERLRFLSPDDVRAVRAAVGTPAYVYDAATLKAQARQPRLLRRPTSTTPRSFPLTLSPPGPLRAGVPQRVRADRQLRDEEQPERGHTAGAARRSRLLALSPAHLRPQLFHSLGLHFDASSGYEVRRAMAAGVPAAKVRPRSFPRHRCITSLTLTVVFWFRSASLARSFRPSSPSLCVWVWV